MGWLVALLILLLLAILPLGVSAIYDSDGFCAQLIVGLFRIQLFPLPKREKKEPGKKKTEKKNTSANSTKERTPQKSKTGGAVSDFLPLLKIALELLDDFRKKLRVNRLEVKVILGGGDPCDLAVNYGKAWAAVGNIMPQLERFLVIKKRNIDVECDFTASQNLIFAHVDLTITLGRILYIAVYYGVRAVCEFIKIKNKRKGGVKK